MQDDGHGCVCNSTLGGGGGVHEGYALGVYEDACFKDAHKGHARGCVRHGTLVGGAASRAGRDPQHTPRRRRSRPAARRAAAAASSARVWAAAVGV